MHASEKSFFISSAAIFSKWLGYFLCYIYGVGKGPDHKKVFIVF